MTVVGIGALSWRDVFVGWVDTPLVRIAGDLAIGAVAAVPVLLATTILAGDPRLDHGQSRPIRRSSIPPGGTGLLIGILAAAVVAPISEEIFYRGFATTAWARSFGPTGAIVRGGLFFAAVHVLTIGGSAFEPAVRAAIVGFVVRLAGRLRARLDLRPPSLAAGVDRASRRLQRDRGPHHRRGPRLIPASRPPAGVGAIHKRAVERPMSPG